MKICKQCGKRRKLTAFDRDARNADGRTNTCKVCRRAAVRNRIADPVGRDDRLAKRRVINARYATANRDATLASKRKYNSTDAARAKKRAYNAKYVPANREKIAARAAVAYAVRTGKLPRVSSLACHACDAPAAHYHHYLGYALEHKLDVVPVCHTHHVD